MGGILIFVPLQLPKANSNVAGGRAGVGCHPPASGAEDSQGPQEKVEMRVTDTNPAP